MLQASSEVEKIFLERVEPLKIRIDFLKEKDLSNELQIKNLLVQLAELQTIFTDLRPLKLKDEVVDAKTTAIETPGAKTNQNKEQQPKQPNGKPVVRPHTALVTPVQKVEKPKKDSDQKVDENDGKPKKVNPKQGGKAVDHVDDQFAKPDVVKVEKKPYVPQVKIVKGTHSPNKVSQDKPALEKEVQQILQQQDKMNQSTVVGGKNDKPKQPLVKKQPEQKKPQEQLVKEEKKEKEEKKDAVQKVPKKDPKPVEHPVVKKDPKAVKDVKKPEQKKPLTNASVVKPKTDETATQEQKTEQKTEGQIEATEPVVDDAQRQNTQAQVQAQDQTQLEKKEVEVVHVPVEQNVVHEAVNEKTQPTSTQIENNQNGKANHQEEVNVAHIAKPQEAVHEISAPVQAQVPQKQVESIVEVITQAVVPKVEHIESSPQEQPKQNAAQSEALNHDSGNAIKTTDSLINQDIVHQENNHQQGIKQEISPV